MTRLMRPEQQPRGPGFILADSLDASFGVRVNLVVLKQGVYASAPASFIALEFLQPSTSLVHESRYEIRLEHLGQARTDSPLYVAAYGPSSLTSKYFPIRGRQSRRRAASIKLECMDRKLLVTSRSARPSVTGVPFTFRIGFVVVHSEMIQITTWPSIDTKWRVLASRRTKVYPLWVNLAAEDGGSSVVTCAAAQRDCHSTCADFGADHMSPEMWRDILLRYWMEECAEAPVEDVSHLIGVRAGLR